MIQTFKLKSGYTAIEDFILNDMNLSLQAKGLYLMLQYNVCNDPYRKWKKDDFREHATEGRTAFDSAWRELKEKGYLKIYMYAGSKASEWNVCYELSSEARPGIHTYYYNAAGEITRTISAEKKQPRKEAVKKDADTAAWELWDADIQNNAASERDTENRYDVKNTGTERDTENRYDVKNAGTERGTENRYDVKNTGNERHTETQYDVSRLSDIYSTDINNIYNNINTDTDNIYNNLSYQSYQSLNNKNIKNNTDRMDRMDEHDMPSSSEILKQIRANIEYDFFISAEDLNERRWFKEIYINISDAVKLRRSTTISGANVSYMELIERLLMLDSDHIRYVIECLEQNRTTPIRNIKRYVLTALYNAPSTINAYYTTLVAGINCRKNQ